MICGLCGKSISDVAYKTKNRKRYHGECYEELKNGAEVSNKRKTKAIQDGDKDSLIDYILQVHTLSKLPYLIEKQIEEFVSKYQYSYSGIEKTLRYFYDVQGNSANGQTTIGIVPYVYEEARKFYEDAYRANVENMNVKVEDRRDTIRINPPNRKIPCVTKIEEL